MRGIVPENLDPRCHGAQRIALKLIAYSDREGAERFLRSALTVSHLCRCQRCRRWCERAQRAAP